MKRALIILVPVAVAIWLVIFHPPADSLSVLPESNTATTTTPTSTPTTPTPVVKEEAPQKDAPTITTSPTTVLQGDPALITINGVGNISNIKSLTIDGKTLDVFNYNNKPSALVGIDLRGKTGNYSLVLTLNNGAVVKKNLVVGERVIAKAPLGIPESLGGNTPESEQQLVSTLVQEGEIISAVKSVPEKLWDGQFRFPLAAPIIVTDVYGYSRQTGGSSISHKGTDFRAASGTPVFAINAGEVRLTTYLRNYGNTIVVDHGAGLLSIYMHLSEIDVTQGEKVSKGELLGKSGQTGYVLGPHLHLTVRINGTSIDPMKFMALLGEK